MAATVEPRSPCPSRVRTRIGSSRVSSSTVELFTLNDEIGVRFPGDPRGFRQSSGAACPLGGIGRRAGLRCQCPSGRGGSRPLAGTGSGAGERHPSGQERDAGSRPPCPVRHGPGAERSGYGETHSMPRFRALLIASQARLAEGRRATLRWWCPMWGVRVQVPGRVRDTLTSVRGKVRDRHFRSRSLLGFRGRGHATA